MKDIQFPDSSFIGAGTSSVLWGGHTTAYINCHISLAKIQCFFSPIKIKKILYSKLKGWNYQKCQMKVPVIKAKRNHRLLKQYFYNSKQGGFTNSSNLSNILNNYTHQKSGESNLLNKSHKTKFF